MEVLVSSLGRLHPLLVHLPIGLLAGILVLEVAGAFSKAKQRFRPAVMALWVACSLAAVLTALCGWQLASEGGYPVRRLFLHRWLSVAFVVAVLLLSSLQFLRSKAWGAILYHNVLVATVVLLLLSGHQGGSLTHGSSYLIKHFSERQALSVPSIEVPSDVAEGDALPGGTPVVPNLSEPVSLAFIREPTVQYVRHVQPILERSCVSCHGPDKIKGGLRLDSPAGLMEGGDYGSVMTPGDPRSSSLYTLVTLSSDDPDVMPQKGDLLSREEQRILHDWILEGGRFAEGVERKGARVQPLQNIFKESDIVPLGAQLTKVVQQLEVQGVVIRFLPGPGGLLSLNFSHCRDGQVPPVSMAVDLAPRTGEIIAAGTTGASQFLVDLQNFREVTRLNLKDSDISDADLVHLRSLTALTDLNLSGTPVTDAGLLTVGKLDSLKNLYLWNCQTTTAAIRELEKQLPYTRVIDSVLNL